MSWDWAKCIIVWGWWMQWDEDLAVNFHRILLFGKWAVSQMRLLAQKNWFLWISWSKQWKYLLVYSLIFPEQRFLRTKWGWHRSSQFLVLMAMIYWYRWSPFSLKLCQVGIHPKGSKSNKTDFASSIHHYFGLVVINNQQRYIFNL